MLILEQMQLEKPHQNRIMSMFNYSGRTQITSAGCEFLIQSDWKLLT